LHLNYFYPLCLFMNPVNLFKTYHIFVFIYGRVYCFWNIFNIWENYHFSILFFQFLFWLFYKMSWVFFMTNESARKRDKIFAYRDRSKARATAIRRHLLEGRSHLFSGSDCDFVDQVGADRQNRLDNKVPKRTIKRRATGLRAIPDWCSVRCGSIK